MYADNLKVRLDKKFDRNQQPWYLGKIKFPGTIDFSNGVAIIVFTSEEGQEEVQFSVLQEKNDFDEDDNNTVFTK